MGWLPVPYALEELMGTYPDAKVVLFQTMVTEWWTHVQKQAKAMLGAGLQDGSLEKVLVNQQIQSNSCG